jgi:predicted negative regulator of RcsB-dependent stress response
VVDYASEEEQVEALKRWWSENGRSVIVGVVLGLLALGGWRGWAWYSEEQSLEASHLYEQVVDHIESGERGQLADLAERLRTDYGGTAYAGLASLAAARAAVDGGDYAAAADWLRWAMENASTDDLSYIARARLARVEGERGNLEIALELIRVEHPASFGGLYAEVRGDLLAASGDEEAAAEAYEAALSADVPPADPQAVERKLNQVKQTAGGAGAEEESS